MPAFTKDENPNDWFIKTPMSGGWNRTHTPGEDLIVPEWFPFAVDAKHREQWSWDQLLLLGMGPDQILNFYLEDEKKNDRPLLLVFKRNRSKDYILFRYSSLLVFNGDFSERPFWVVRIPSEHSLFKTNTSNSLFLTTLDEFFHWLDPVELRKQCQKKID